MKARLGSGPAENFVVGAFAGGKLVGTAGFYRELGPKLRHKGHVWGERRALKIGDRYLDEEYMVLRIGPAL